MTPQERLAGRQLAAGTLAGHWTLEDLDQPSPGCQELIDVRHGWRQKALVNGKPAPPEHQHRNLAREWMETYRTEWDELLREHLAQELDTTAA